MKDVTDSRLRGIGIAPGYAVGFALVCEYAIERQIELPSREILNSEIDGEHAKLAEALELTGRDLRGTEERAIEEPKLADVAGLLAAHLAMASEIATVTRNLIGQDRVNVEWALESVISHFVERFQRLDNKVFREREQDVRDVGRRLLRHLSGATPPERTPVPSGTVVVAAELMPSEALEFAHSGVVAFVTEHGGTFSHTAIVARSMGIPAVAAVAGATTRIIPGMRLLVDGERGHVTISPSSKKEERFAARKRAYDVRSGSIAAEEHLPCVTMDGTEISLVANVGLPDEVAQVDEHHLPGVGLFRTEFLFLEAHKRPGLRRQMATYRALADRLEGLPIVIRTFDLGGDKMPPFLANDPVAQTKLHLRGLRFSLAEHRLLETQLRAILRAARSEHIRILFPMVIGGDDLARAIELAAKVATEEGISRCPSVGAMIETPAALYSLDRILELADFVAIGTNDLTQYMLASDRDYADSVEDLSASHPAVIRAIRQVVQAAAAGKCPLCVCGEDAGDPDFARLLVGLGVRELSVSPTRSGRVRHVLRQIEARDATKLADEALQCDSLREVRELLHQTRPVGSRR
jgi:phosphotransferase system enzyme I (PtsI)